MTEEEFQSRLDELGLKAEEYKDILHGKSVRFRHPIIGIIENINYSQEAVDDLKELHNIDGGGEVRAAAIKLLEERSELIAIRLIQNGDVDTFFQMYSFGHLEELVEKFPGLAKIVANPKWKPRGASQQ